MNIIQKIAKMDQSNEYFIFGGTSDQISELRLKIFLKFKTNSF